MKPRCAEEAYLFNRLLVFVDDNTGGGGSLELQAMPPMFFLDENGNRGHMVVGRVPGLRRCRTNI